MFTPEVRFGLAPRDSALDFLMDAVSQLEEESDNAKDPETAKTIEAELVKYNRAFDLIMCGNNLSEVATFLRDQVTELRNQAKNQEDYKNTQRLSCLADDLSSAA